ncbi:MAG: hypothetical protein LUI08_06705 [Prevotella sp.]|nr:hypothetical protein [Prevotella sp.]
MRKRIILATTKCFIIAAVAAALASCSDSGSKKPEEKPLNISVYLDLSNRLVVNNGVPDQKTKDLEIVDYLCDYFYDATKGPKILKSGNKMNIIFYPAPQDPGIDSLSDELSIDMSKIDVKEKLNTLNGFKQKFHDNLSKIYDKTIQEQKWIGSDIWGFFSDKSKIDVQCIDDNCRNIIVILTDGFIYHKDNKIKEGDAYSYVLAETLANPKSSLIAKRNDLNNIEVLVLEITPGNAARKDKMVSVLTDWFNAMGVSKLQIAESDVIKTTKTVIDKFLSE